MTSWTELRGVGGTANTASRVAIYGSTAPTRNWHIEAQQGGERGKLWSHTYQAERDARNVVAAMIERTAADGWRDLSKTSIEADRLRQHREADT